MWRKIEINKQNIDTNYSDKVALIKMPNKSKYAGYKFWHPYKLIGYGSNSYARTISYTYDWTFKLFKKDIEKEISVEEFEEAFDSMSDCTRAKSNETYLIVKEPEKVEKEIEIDSELKNKKECSECTKNLEENGYL